MMRESSLEMSIKPFSLVEMCVHHIDEAFRILGGGSLCELEIEQGGKVFCLFEVHLSKCQP